MWPRVIQERPNFPLVIIGDGDGRPRLEALAGQLGSNVRFLGTVDDAARDVYLKSCRCFCLPARGEGFGLVYLEAMRAGKPVLAGSLDAGREVVLDGITGRTVDPTNAEELVAGILDVSGEKAEQMGIAGLERFEQHFCYEKFVARFSRHVREVVEGRGRRAEGGEPASVIGRRRRAEGGEPEEEVSGDGMER